MQVFKKLLFGILGMKNYLSVLQRGFFLCYRIGILKSSQIYDCHYYVKKLIKKGDTVIDIGANLGYYSKLFSEWVGAEGHVYSVEPIAIYNEIFKSATRKNKNITLFPYALGLEESHITLVTSSKSGYLSTGLPHVYNPEEDGKLEDQGHVFQAEMKIPLELFRDLKTINYIKCDIEGYEHVVLSNLQPLIDKYKPIVQVELWGQNRVFIFKMMCDMGYVTCRVTKDTHQLSSNELLIKDGYGDFIFIPQDKIVDCNITNASK